MSAFRKWSLGLGASLALHAGSALLLLPFLEARPFEQQRTVMARLDMETLTVPQQSAEQMRPRSESARQGHADASAAGFGQIPTSRAESGLLPAEVAAFVDARGTETPNLSQRGKEAETSEPHGTIVRVAAATVSAVLTQAQAKEEPAMARPIASFGVRLADANAFHIRDQPKKIQPDEIVPAAVRSDAATDLVPISPLAADREPDATEPIARPPASTPLLAGAPVGDKPSDLRPDVSVSSETALPNTVAETIPSIADSATVLLAWSGDFSLEIRQNTVDAAAALRVENPQADGQALRDELARKLTDVRCSRAQTSYDPTSGALELRGHVKSDADRDTLVAALESELDGAIPILDRLNRLGEPQCEVLNFLSDMELPQSVEQFINPLIIGDDLHTRVYSFRDGQAMRFEVFGADYDAWFYLDYFDGEGQVLHLAPNSKIAPFVIQARQRLVLGGGGAEDIAAGLFELRVSPPFGQDIAVAMVANRQIFDQDRDLVEPADTYLAEVARRVRAMRMEFEDFKGEWVYLFVETQPGQ